MSADNMYVIRKHPNGGYAAIMEFASNDAYRDVRPQDKKYDSIEDAFLWASEQYTEYGVSLHPECRTRNGA